MIKDKRLTIGLAVYNCADMIDRKMESIFALQSPFELIISDNHSTDGTFEKCLSYATRDNVTLVRHHKNIGAWNNFLSILEHVNTEFFCFTAHDDIMMPDFVEIEFEKDVVTVCGKLKQYGPKKFRLDNYPASNHTQYLKNGRYNNCFYGIHRTEFLKKSMVRDNFLFNDTATMLNMTNYGSIKVVDKVTIRSYSGGISTRGMSVNLKSTGEKIPYLKFVRWYYSRYKMSFFRNIAFFMSLLTYGIGALAVDYWRSKKGGKDQKSSNHNHAETSIYQAANFKI